MQPFPARCSIQPGGGAPAEEAACTVELSDSAVTVAPAGAPALRLRFTEIARWTVEDHAVALELSGGGRVVLSALGKRLDPFCRALPAARTEHLGEALLLLEGGPAAEESGELRWRGAEAPAEACRVRLQRTSLVVFPRESLPFRVGYGEVQGVAFDAEAWAVELALDDGRTLELLRFGKRTDAFRAGLSERRAALASRALRALQALAPEVPALPLRALGALLPDGVPAARTAVEAAAPGAWQAMLSRAFAAGARREAAEHLAGRAGEAWLAVKETDPPASGAEADAETGAATGRRPAEGEPMEPEAAQAGPTVEAEPRQGSTLPEELAGREVLYLFRIGRALALEVPSSTESATYVFRAGDDPARSVRAVVRALAAIQFRREPISLPEADLLGARGARYGEALRLLPGLRTARESFLGRAVHSGPDAWRRALDAALARA